MAKTDPDGHFGPAELDGLHVVIADTTEGGACLNGHEYDFEEKKKKITCNYRYQAFEQAKSEKRIRNRLHSYDRKIPQVNQDDGQLRLFITTSVYRTRRGGMGPGWLPVMLSLPGAGDWHLGGPIKPLPRSRIDREPETIPKGMNFTNARWPYWNNAHHLISKGTFKRCILEHSATLQVLMQTALLEAKYNINHKVNMLLIPMDLEVAAILGFLRHIQLDHPDAAVGKEKMSHPIYDKMVRDMEEDGLEKIISEYARLLADAERARDQPENHALPNPKLDKAKLERLSRRLLNLILNLGAVAAGKSLDAGADALGYG